MTTTAAAERADVTQLSTHDGVEAYEALRGSPVWSDEMVIRAGITIEDVPMVTIGGGPASFALVDFLRISGVPTHEIRVVSPQPRAYENLHHLMRRSQIQDTDPLRSDSMSRVDNAWGFPSYAVEYAMKRRTVRPLWKVLTEPVASEFYNPTPRQVFGGIDREAERISWAAMLAPGRAQVVRKRETGGYFTVVTPLDGSASYALRSRYLHLGTGYPGVNCVPEISSYRLEHNEYFRVVNAYEPHEHVYEVLRRRPGTVLVRGSGITASRVIQRLHDDHERLGTDVRILHFFRTFVDGKTGRRTFRRPGGDGWSYQAFSSPKAAGAGQLRRRLLKMDNAQRAEFIRSMGGTTSAKRRVWQRQLRKGRKAGFYQAFNGEVSDMRPVGSAKVELEVDVSTLPENTRLEVDFVIDCTGMKSVIGDSPLLSDLVERGGAGLNAMDGLDVGSHFEVRGMEQGAGQVYASGVIARGGYMAPVDSFWGFSHVAMLICDDLARRGFCNRLGLTRSVSNWMKWIAGKAP